MSIVRIPHVHSIVIGMLLPSKPEFFFIFVMHNIVAMLPAVPRPQTNKLSLQVIAFDCVIDTRLPYPLTELSCCIISTNFKWPCSQYYRETSCTNCNQVAQRIIKTSPGNFRSVTPSQVNEFLAQTTVSKWSLVRESLCTVQSVCLVRSIAVGGILRLSNLPWEPRRAELPHMRNARLINSFRHRRYTHTRIYARA